MKKVLSAVLVTASAFTVLSACKVDTSTTGSLASEAAQSSSNSGNFSATGDGQPEASSASPTSNYSAAEQNAIESAQSYLSMGTGYSRAGLIEQLSSSSGEGFARADAVFAINHISVNWSQQAVESAKGYLSTGSGYSRAGLIEQLSSKSGEQFTVAQATYAANQVGLGTSSGARAGAAGSSATSSTVAQQNAIQSAQSYLSMGTGYSRAGLIEQLSSKSGEGFSLTDAVYAVDHVKVNWYEQAVASAKGYLSMGTGYSRADLIEQLSSEAGEQFTLAQATYAANQVGLR